MVSGHAEDVCGRCVFGCNLAMRVNHQQPSCGGGRACGAPTRAHRSIATTLATITTATVALATATTATTATATTATATRASHACRVRIERSTSRIRAVHRAGRVNERAEPVELRGAAVSAKLG